nr:ribonuclease H-like domain-containing protein [Tanacetum cinerariifolium]
MSEPMTTQAIPTQSPLTYPEWPNQPPNPTSSSFTQDHTYISLTQQEPSTSVPTQPMPTFSQPTFTQPAVHFQQTQPNQNVQQNPQNSNQVQTQQFQQFQTTTISVNNAKFPYLEKEKYEIWTMKMEYWIQNTDHNLWRIIQEANSPKRLGKDSKGNTIVHPPVSYEEHVVVQRENKVRTLLLQALPEDHILDFHHYDDARDIWMAVKARFGGNEESKKMRKTMLKQQFTEFSMTEEEGLHKGYDRALPSSWSQVVLALKTRGGLESMSFDDLYNKLRSLKLDVRIGHNYGVKAVALISSAFTSGHSYNIMECVLHSFVAENDPDQDMIYEDFDQVGQMEMEELDLKWKLAMLSLRINKECKVKTVDDKARYSAYKEGNSPKRLGKDSKGNTIVHPPVSYEEHVAVQRENKMVVKARFGGNEESKKMRKTMLKQQFTEFSVTEKEGLHKGYDRFQKILSQLNQVQARPDNDDINMKFLKALPSSWSQVALALKTRGVLESMSFDDMYNKLRSLELDVRIGHNYGVKAAAAPIYSAFVELLVLADQMEMKELDLKWQLAMLSLRINRECKVKTVDDKARYSAYKVTKVKTDEPKALVSVDSMVNWSDHEAKNKTAVFEKVYEMMAGLNGDHAAKGAASVSDAAAEFAMMGISPQTKTKDSPTSVDVKTVPEPDIEDQNSVPCKSKAASVPTGSRNSSASVNAGRSDSTASRNRPVVNSVGRPNPAGRIGKAAHHSADQPNPAGWSKRSAPVSAGRPVSASWFNPTARPYFRPSSVYFNNLYWPEIYDSMYVNEGRWGTAVNPSADNDLGIVDSGCSRSMTGNKEMLDDFVQVNGRHEPKGRLVVVHLYILTHLQDGFCWSFYVFAGGSHSCWIFVPAGSYGLCWWLRVPTGRHTSAGGFISIGGNLYLLSQRSFYCAPYDTAGWSVSTGGHSVSTGSLQSCWYNHVSADEQS